MCPNCKNQFIASDGEKIPPNIVVGNYQFYPYQTKQFDEPQIFAYSIALVEDNEDDGFGEFYTYLDFWVVKDIDNVKKTLKRRGVTVDSKNYQIKVYYTDGSWDFVSLRETLS